LTSNDKRLADLVADFCASKLDASHVFTVTGGGAMYLNDAFGKHPDIEVVPMHHEQSASMAAEGYYRETGKVAVCQVTTGPGGANAITGCAGAWVDSEAIIFISGQVETISLISGNNRQTGVQELDIIGMVKSITKEAIRLTDPHMISYELARLVDVATSGRPGPVWLDIPLDLQNFAITNPDMLPKYLKPKEDVRTTKLRAAKFRKIMDLLKRSKRPCLLVGNGCRTSAPTLRKFLEMNEMPIITGWNARDLITEDPNLLGSAGLFGNRAANLALHKADLVLGLGYRFSVPQVGYDPSCYAPNAVIAAVDIDPEEFHKVQSFIDVPVLSSVADFLESACAEGRELLSGMSAGWLDFCHYLTDFKFDPRPQDEEKCNSFDFNGLLEGSLEEGDTVVTDMGTSFTCTHQDLAVKQGVKMFTSSGVAAMGFGLPGAIGSSLAKTDGRTLLITGDGGLMFNLQELQTALTLDLNLKIVVYENDGYLTMKHMQNARFQHLVGSEGGSKVQCADFIKVATALGIGAKEICKPSEMPDAVHWLLDDFQGPKLLVIHLDPWQPLLPRVQTRSDSSGRLYPPSLDQMFPHLSEEVEDSIEQRFRLI
jgi:acetolactate synthase-1/2/3 large subunit